MINKQVAFRYQGEDLQFNLSQSLFSSYDIDTGSKLLLETVARKMDLCSCESVADVGCGVGVLGVAVKKRHPNLRLLAVDRDALAIQVARENARINGLGPVEFRGGLGLGGASREADGSEHRDAGDSGSIRSAASRGAWDLVLSNLPAKAGHPVLRHMIVSFAESLSDAGRAAVVIVKPLEKLAEEALAGSGIPAVYCEQGREHTVFHYRHAAQIRKEQPPLSSYLRGELSPVLCGVRYTLATAYGLPDFDTVGRASELAAGILDGMPVEGTVLFWNPGQGHVAVFAHRKYGTRIERYIVAGRDRLALEMTAKNLADNGAAPEKIAMAHAAFPADLSPITAKGHFMICLGDGDLSGKWQDGFLRQAGGLVEEGGKLVFSARSTTVQRVTKRHPGFAIIGSRRTHGMKAVVLQKK